MLSRHKPFIINPIAVKASTFSAGLITDRGYSPEEMLLSGFQKK
jgi:hypothetical protein